MSATDSMKQTQNSIDGEQVLERQVPCRPADLANLMLAGPGLRSRQRARDQQADQAGIALKRQVLLRLSALDPDPEDFDSALDTIIKELGPPYGPVRGICLGVRNEWEAACSSPQFLGWLLQEAVRESDGQRKGKKRAN